jgi:putative transposase
MIAELVVNALTITAWTRGHKGLEGVTCHTDTGSQHPSISYTERRRDIGAQPSIGTIGDRCDHAMTKSVMGIYKTELHRNPAVLAANGGHWRGPNDLAVATCAWVSWFNAERLHGEVRDRIPAEIEAEYSHSDQAEVAREIQMTGSPRNPDLFLGGSSRPLACETLARSREIS